ncbi:Putative gustatory receptor 43a [Trachymyrmex zeteki]|uniref:Gustatory receptor n=1 Tax=Mycetomoellerius zeteki TaxID=64791 RepID=A0A151XJK3_9HYME|nr:Putative gustatory receptor 43a [Trachymyrmex zeteki]
MKLFTRPKCFSEAIALMTSLNCLLGLRAFEYPRGYSRPILSLIYLLFICGIYSCSSLYLERKYNANVALMKLEYILYEVLMYIIIVSVILKMLLGWWHTKKFKVCCKKIFEIDETLRQLGLSVNYDRIYFMTNGIIIMWIITIIIANIIKLGIFELNDYAKIMKVEQRKYIFSKNMIQLRRRKQSRMNVFVSKESQNRVVSQIETEFVPPQFKKELQSKLQNRSRRHSATMAKCQERKHLLQIIKQVHLELCKITKLVCTILGVQMAWEIGEIIVILTGSLYYFYIRYITQQYKILLEQTILILAFSSLSILKAVYLSRVCKDAADEANKTIEIIHAIYGCDADTDMQEELLYIINCIQQFSIQILQSPKTFFVFGITLDNRILSSILKTVTTYIVIMIQMSHALESNNDVQLDVEL